MVEELNLSNDAIDAICNLIHHHTGKAFGTANVATLVRLVREQVPERDIYDQMRAEMARLPKHREGDKHRVVIYTDGSGHIETNSVRNSDSSFIHATDMLRVLERFGKSQDQMDIETIEKHLETQDASCDVTKAAKRLLNKIKKMPDQKKST